MNTFVTTARNITRPSYCLPTSAWSVRSAPARNTLCSFPSSAPENLPALLKCLPLQAPAAARLELAVATRSRPTMASPDRVPHARAKARFFKALNVATEAATHKDYLAEPKHSKTIYEIARWLVDTRPAKNR